jgi:hypothetical protein
LLYEAGVTSKDLIFMLSFAKIWLLLLITLVFIIELGWRDMELDSRVLKE